MRRRTFLFATFGPAWLAAEENRGPLDTLAYVQRDGLWLRDLPDGRPLRIAAGAKIDSPRTPPGVASGNANPTPLTADARYRDAAPRWPADGRHILFCRIDRVNRQTVWLMLADGGEAEPGAGPVAVDGDEDMAWFGYGGIAWRNALDRRPPGSAE